ncbi:MAG: HU family DNA-binding protein [Bradymonadia bacterium]
MKKAELIAEVHQSIDGELTKKKVGEIINALFDAVGGSIVKDGRFSAPGFGTFTVKTRAARTGRNPRTKETIQIPESKNVGFKPAPELKNKVNQ